MAMRGELARGRASQEKQLWHFHFHFYALVIAGSEWEWYMWDGVGLSAAICS